MWQQLSCLVTSSPKRDESPGYPSPYLQLYFPTLLLSETNAKREGKKDQMKALCWGFHGGSARKNPPANAGDTGSIPGPGRSHMP